VARDYNWGISGFFNYLRCTGCGLVFQCPECLEKNFSQLYPKFYGAHANGSPKDIVGKINTRANEIRARTLETFLASGTLFDVGCGSGFFLEFMRRRGWEVSGLDPAKEHVTFAKEKLGINNIAQGVWSSADKKIEKVDVVSFLHVIEHLNNPVENLAAARNILVPDGLLIIETPNIKSWPARIFKSRWVTLDAPRHLNLFSPNNLRHALEKANFELLHLSTYSPSTMEYTESLRYTLMDLKVRQRNIPFRNSENRIVSKESDAQKLFQRIKKTIHYCEGIFFNSINVLSDSIGYGCNLLIVARATGKFGK
jgi:2-polyprenyl-3-methyl-5-hydroxy-6-metoxy-1,4-benzoquinol methylase